MSEANPNVCSNCLEHGETCTSSRPAKKRGTKPLVERLGDTSTAVVAAAYEHHELSDLQAWCAPAIAPQALIMDLVEIYFEVVYPIFPFFHPATTLRRISRGEYQIDQQFFAVVMAMCSLASARARDGAIFSGRWDLRSLSSPASEFFFSTAASVIPRDAGASNDFDYMRTCALLSITAIQYGQPRTMHYYLGLYHTYVETDGLHDEANWPKAIGPIETEERRRLFWSIYTLDVYAAVVWGRIVRTREAQSNVTYPTAIDDAKIGNVQSGSNTWSVLDRQLPEVAASQDVSNCWLYGWNFTTDLYRVLEHVLDQYRGRRPEHRPSTPIDTIFGGRSTTSSSVLDAISNMYNGLPSRFKETPPAVSETDHQLNFQTANIVASIQLVRMMLLAAEDTTIEQRCNIARELLEAFSNVPVQYLRAFSSPLLHHLAGIGSILGSAFENSLQPSSYQHIRTVLLSLVQLLADLEVGLYCTAGASSRIQKLVERIDLYISNQQQLVMAPQTLATSFEQPGKAATAIASSTNDDPSSFLLPPDLLTDWSWAFDFA